MIDPCPLCGQLTADPVSSTPYVDVFAALRAQFGDGIDESLEQRYTPAETADEYRCRTCGLQYFSPMNPGGPDFYAALASSDRYYRGDRWEYELALAAIPDATTRVLDVGCGRGDFLVQAGLQSESVVGAETNPDAHPHLRRRGIDFHPGDIADLDDQFDLICAFQVFEHLADVGQLLTPALDRLAPGGALFLSVPNRQRLAAHPRLEPLDLPPHHVSRWSPAQFDELARGRGLEVRAVHRQRKSLSSTVKVVLHRTVGRSRAVPGGPSWRGVLRRAPLANAMAVELVRAGEG
ncbi:MAG: class I SAM-dependent methyltransferase [Acidimicrobiales bacterium]